jgi:hypothetical protein
LNLLARVRDFTPESHPRRAAHFDQRSVPNDIGLCDGIAARQRCAFLKINSGSTRPPLRNEALVRDVTFDHHREVEILSAIHVDGGLMNMHAERKADALNSGCNLGEPKLMKCGLGEIKFRASRHFEVRLVSLIPNGDGVAHSREKKVMCIREYRHEIVPPFARLHGKEIEAWIERRIRVQLNVDRGGIQWRLDEGDGGGRDLNATKLGRPDVEVEGYVSAGQAPFFRREVSDKEELDSLALRVSDRASFETGRCKDGTVLCP